MAEVGELGFTACRDLCRLERSQNSGAQIVSGCPGLRKIYRVETLFWLEVESNNISRNRLLDKTVARWIKAKCYADAAGVHLIFVLLGMPWSGRPHGRLSRI